MSNSAFRKLLKSSMSVAFATVISRILGFLRVVLEARLFGGGALASAWFLAFMIPNSLRRILGEGALGSVVVPLLSDDNQNNNDKVARLKIAKIIISVSLLLILITTTVAITAIVISANFSIESEKNRLFLQLLPILMPYCIFICLCGVIGAILNLRKIFFLPALGALSLNIFLIANLLILPHFFHDDLLLILRLLGFMVVASGVVQLYYFFILLAKNNYLPLFKFSEFKNQRFFKDFWHMFLPAFIGTSALQLGLIIDKSLAFGISEQALPSLTYSDRIIYLPIGVFAVSFGSVSLSYLSNYAAQKKYDDMIEALFYGLKSLLYVCIPCVVLIFILRREIISLICYGGNFSLSDLEQTNYAIIFYVWGIPFFASLKILTAAFYSRKDMKTPLYISLTCIAVNIILNLILMFPLKQGGLALATTISAVLNNALLIIFLKRQLNINLSKFKNFSISVFKIIFANLLVAGILIAIPYIVSVNITIGNKWAEGLYITVMGIIFAVFYLLFSYIFKLNEAKELFKIFKR